MGSPTASGCGPQLSTASVWGRNAASKGLGSDKKHGHVTHTHTDVYSETPVTAPGRGTRVSLPGYQAKTRQNTRKTLLSQHNQHWALGKKKKKKKAPTYPGDSILPNKTTGHTCVCVPGHHWDPHGDPSWVTPVRTSWDITRTPVRRGLPLMRPAGRQICHLDVPKATRTPPGTN